MAFTYWRTKGMLAGCLLVIFLLAASVPGYAQVTEPKDTMFQVSTVTGLEHGVFFPVTTVGELKTARQHRCGCLRGNGRRTDSHRRQGL